MRTTLNALGTVLICLLGPVGVGLAQENPPAPAAAVANPLSAHHKAIYRGVKAMLLRSAEKMPEESYGFKPTDSVRSFGQIVGHAAESQYAFCSRALGEKSPAPKIEQTRTSKADLVAALREAFAYCDRAYDGMTDASATETIKFMGGDAPRIAALNVNSLHGVEHYGNLVVYLRMKNLVPPSSEPGFVQEMQKK
jgi:uncharacterized damage-inducible protein DinB